VPGRVDGHCHGVHGRPKREMEVSPSRVCKGEGTRGRARELEGIGEGCRHARMAQARGVVCSMAQDFTTGVPLLFPFPPNACIQRMYCSYSVVDQSEVCWMLASCVCVLTGW
jgi:hypothetical protein